MPEFFATKFGEAARPPAVRGWSPPPSRRASASPTSRSPARSRCARRSSRAGADPEKIAVVLNTADEAIFDAAATRRAAARRRRFTLICHGSDRGALRARHAIEAVAAARGRDPGPAARDLRRGVAAPGAASARAPSSVSATGSTSATAGCPIEELLDAIAAADAGVVAMKRDPFRDLTHCNKMYDFVAMRRPVIMSRTRSVEAYFSDDAFLWFTAEDPDDLARAIRRLYADPALGDRLVEQAEPRSSPTAGRASGGSTSATSCRPRPAERRWPTATCRRRSTPRPGRRR